MPPLTSHFFSLEQMLSQILLKLFLPLDQMILGTDFVARICIAGDDFDVGAD